MPGELSGSVCARGASWNRLDGGFGGQIRTPSIFPLPMPRADCLPLPPGEVCPPRRAEARAGHLHTGRTHLYHGLYQNEPAGAGLVGPGNEAAWSAALGTWPPQTPCQPPCPRMGCLLHPLPKRSQVPKCAVLCWMGRGWEAGSAGEGGFSQAGGYPALQVNRSGVGAGGACQAACPGGCVPRRGQALSPSVPWLMCVTNQGGGFGVTAHTPPPLLRPHRKTLRSPLPCKRWTRAMGSCCLSTTPIPASSTSAGR